MTVAAFPLAGGAGGVVVAAPAPASLGNHTSKVYRLSAEELDEQAEREKARRSRAARYLLRDQLIDLSKVKQFTSKAVNADGSMAIFPGRFAMCGRRRIDANKPVTVSLHNGVAHLSGLQLCGSVWACPVCMAKIRQERATKLENGLEEWFLQTGLGDTGHENRGAFITLTVRHGVRHTLEQTLKTVADSFTAILATPEYAGRKRQRTFTLPDGVGKLVAFREDLAAQGGEVLEETRTPKLDRDGRPNGKTVVKLKVFVPGERQRLNAIGTVRAAEITVGQNGWHPHIHVLLITERELSAEELEELETAWFRRWKTAVGRHGYQTLKEHGIDVRPLDRANLGTYVTKVQDQPRTERRIALELTRPDLKKGRGKGRTPFQVLEDCVFEGQQAAKRGDLHAFHPQTGELMSAGHQAQLCQVKKCEHPVCVNARLWWEYETATLGHRALTWAPGLRAKLGMEELEKTDEEIANAEVEEAEVIFVLDDVQWKVLGRVKGARAELLETVETAAPEVREAEVELYLDRLFKQNPETVQQVLAGGHERISVGHEWIETDS